MDIIEKHSISAYLSFIMKLNETIFKPLFIKMIEWAQINSINKENYLISSRTIFFYQLIDAIVDKLKVNFFI